MKKKLVEEQLSVLTSMFSILIVLLIFVMVILNIVVIESLFQEKFFWKMGLWILLLAVLFLINKPKREEKNEKEKYFNRIPRI